LNRKSESSDTLTVPPALSNDAKYIVELSASLHDCNVTLDYCRALYGYAEADLTLEKEENARLAEKNAKYLKDIESLKEFLQVAESYSSSLLKELEKLKIQKFGNERQTISAQKDEIMRLRSIEQDLEIKLGYAANNTKYIGLLEHYFQQKGIHMPSYSEIFNAGGSNVRMYLDFVNPSKYESHETQEVTGILEGTGISEVLEVLDEY
jgi:hypothetical protein